MNNDTSFTANHLSMVATVGMWALSALCALCMGLLCLMPWLCIASTLYPPIEEWRNQGAIAKHPYGIC